MAQQLQPVTLMPPPYVLISEILYSSEGFKTANNLA